MKTQFVIRKGWKLLKEVDYPITLTNKDTVMLNDIEYPVDSCFLDLDKSVIVILLGSYYER